MHRSKRSYRLIHRQEEDCINTELLQPRLVFLCITEDLCMKLSDAITRNESRDTVETE
jgi:hypothetical protein